MHTLPFHHLYTSLSTSLMEYKHTEDPNPNPNYNPNLLTQMEMNQFFNTQTTPYTSYKYNTASSSHNKKHKSNNQHETYTGNPFLRNPNPNPKTNQLSFARPFDLNQKLPYPHSSSQILSHKKKAFSPGPKLVNLSNIGKVRKMLMACQPGMMVSVPKQGPVHSLILKAKWDNLIFYRGQNFHTHLMGEFYGNMITTTNHKGLFEIDTVVHDKHVHVDVYVLCKALKIDPNLFPQPCINVYDAFKFDKDEFEKYVKLFCGSEVPTGLCAENCGISFAHLLPVYQQLAFILRANILPKPFMDKYLDFVDMKVMFQMITNSVEFNIIYVIILHMFLAYQLDFMPFGLLLTAIFDMYHIPMPRNIVERAEFCYVEDLVTPQVPLSEIKPYKFSSLEKATVEASHNPVKENEILRKIINDLDVKINDNNTKIRGLEDENIEISSRLAVIESKLGMPKEECVSEPNEKSVGLNEDVDEKKNVAMVATADLENLPGLTDFDPSLGFVATIEKIINE